MTSQLFANIYLNELDQFIKRELRVKCYVRYCDDFLIADYADFGMRINADIQRFLGEKLRLQIHPDKIILKKWSEGIDFLGYVVFPHFTLLRTKTKRRMFKKIETAKGRLNLPNGSLKTFRQTVMSYMGVCSHARTFDLMKELRKIYQNEYKKYVAQKRTAIDIFPPSWYY